MQSEGLRVGVVGVGYWGSRHVRVLRSTTGVLSVIGVDQRFPRIDDGHPQIDHGIAAYADIEDALPHVDAVITHGGTIIARAFNQVETLKDATAHAEMLAITQAESVIGDWRLNECDLYVTKEPCPMCAGAMVHVRLRRVIFGCSDARGGAAGGGG